MSSSADRGTNVLGAGLTWVVSVALLAYGGLLLDRRLGTLPLFVVVGALAGAGGGFIHFLSRVAPEMLPFGRKGDSDSPGSSSDKGRPPDN